MKTLTLLITSAFLIFGASLTQAEKITAGPKGGRLLDNDGPRAEFFVEKDRSISITFYDAALKPVPVTEQSVTAIAEAPSGKTKIEFEKKGDILVSKASLPDGDGYIVVLQFKSKPDAKVKIVRITLQMVQCEGCKRAEYACTCDH
jgi:hypothetical protein